MKLTTEMIKKLIKEELNSIEEARPPTKNRGVIQFEGYKLVYYVYPMNVTTRDNVEGFKGKGLVGKDWFSRNGQSRCRPVTIWQSTFVGNRARYVYRAKATLSGRASSRPECGGIGAACRHYSIHKKRKELLRASD